MHTGDRFSFRKRGAQRKKRQRYGMTESVLHMAERVNKSAKLVEKWNIICACNE